jgi:hypothetical protein
MRPIFKNQKLPGVEMFYPPYKKKHTRLFNLLMKPGRYSQTPQAAAPPAAFPDQSSRGTAARTSRWVTSRALAALYRAEMFVLFPLVTTAVATLSFVAFAAPLTAIAVTDPPALRKYRIQRKAAHRT